jgi:membrane-bound serine protease (ClpP class)
VVTGLFFAFAVTKVVMAHRKPAVTGKEGLVGELAEARTFLEPEGKVFLKGELWDATAVDGPIGAGEAVEILAVDGFCLQVTRAKRD